MRNTASLIRYQGNYFQAPIQLAGIHVANGSRLLKQCGLQFLGFDCAGWLGFAGEHHSGPVFTHLLGCFFEHLAIEKVLAFSIDIKNSRYRSIREPA